MPSLSTRAGTAADVVRDTAVALVGATERVAPELDGAIASAMLATAVVAPSAIPAARPSTPIFMNISGLYLCNDCDLRTPGAPRWLLSAGNKQDKRHLDDSCRYPLRALPCRSLSGIAGIGEQLRRDHDVAERGLAAGVRPIAMSAHVGVMIVTTGRGPRWPIRCRACACCGRGGSTRARCGRSPSLAQGWPRYLRFSRSGGPMTGSVRQLSAPDQA